MNSKTVRLILLAAAIGLGTFRLPVSAQPVDPVRLTDAHADLFLLFRPELPETNRLALVVRDEDRGTDYKTNEVVLVARESARITLPAGTPFGDAGDPLWILPQSQDPNLLYLGVSAEAIPLNAFRGPLTLRLLQVEGPGHLYVWQAGEFGALQVKMNSSDGIDDSDKTTPIVGSHEHLNWGFSTNGTYRVTFRAEGTEAGSGQMVTSEASTFIWEIEPLPPAPAVPPRLSAPTFTPGGTFGFLLEGTVGTSYQVEGTADFKTWTRVTTVKLAVSPTPVTVPASTPFQFLRAVALP